jgi:hypothetical protein
MAVGAPDPGPRRPQCPAFDIAADDRGPSEAKISAAARPWPPAMPVMKVLKPDNLFIEKSPSR